MSLRNCYLLLIGLMLASESGCCCWDWGPGGSPCDRTWCCSQCGPVFWNEWFSCPPLCRDFCSCCGDFTASDNPYVLSGPTESRFGRLYDDGSRRNRQSGSQVDQYQYDPEPARPTPARRPTPAEELPSVEPTTSVQTNEFGQTVSYDREPRHYRGTRSMRYEDQAGYDEPIDSPRTYRKLGKPQRPDRYAR
jgi:hypothetical protein